MFLLPGQLGDPQDSVAQSHFCVPDAQERPGSHLSMAQQCHKRTFSPSTTHSSQPHCAMLVNQCTPVFNISLTLTLRPHRGAEPQPSVLPHPDHSLPMAPPSPTGIIICSSQEGGPQWRLFSPSTRETWSSGTPGSSEHQDTPPGIFK